MRTCVHCHAPLDDDVFSPAAGGFCPHCGGRNSPGFDSSSAQMIFWRQERRRLLVGAAFFVCCLVAALVFLLLHRSTSNSPARKVKHAIFGSEITKVAESRGGNGEQPNGQGQGSDRNGRGTSGNGREGSNSSGGAGREGGTGNGGAGQEGAGAGGGGMNAGGGGARTRGGSRSGNQREGLDPDRPVHEALPDQADPGLEAPAARSIGWLDRFFGVNETRGEIRAGQGGTGEDASSSGNSNRTDRASTNQIAAETTQAGGHADPLRDQTPPPPISQTRRQVTNSQPAALNDNMELLLRQNRAGSGDVRISLMWNNKNDLDLHVMDPRGFEINYLTRRSPSGGVLDIDMNASSPLRAPAVENVFWPVNGAPAGKYRVFVNFYQSHDAVRSSSYQVRILIRGRTFDFQGAIRDGEPKRLIHEFTLTR